MNDKELSVLKKLSDSVDAAAACALDEGERAILRTIISEYTKPTIEKGKSQ